MYWPTRQLWRLSKHFNDCSLCETAFWHCWRLDVLKRAAEANDAEIAALRIIKEECVQFYRPPANIWTDFRSISKLLASQGVINAREKEIISLKAEVRSQGESKAEIRAQSVSKALVETWFHITYIVFSKTNRNEETSGRERCRTAGERSVSI